MLHTRVLVYREEGLPTRTKTDKPQGRLVCRRGENRRQEKDKLNICSLALFHGIDQLKQLAAIDNLDEGLTDLVVRHHIDCRRMVEPQAVAEIAIGFHLGGQLSLRIDGEGQIELVLSGKLLREGMKVVFADFELVLETRVPEFIADLFLMSVKVARKYGGVIGPGVHLQRKIVHHHRNMVSPRRLLNQRVGAGAVRAFQIFKYHNGNLRTLGRPQGRIVRALRERERGRHQN